MIRRLHVVGLVVVALAAPASAGPVTSGASAPGAGDTGNTGDASGDADDDTSNDGLHLFTAAAWAALEMGIPAWYYWHTQDAQEVDWERPSWKDKLTFHSVRFDTNPFHVN